MESLFRVSLSVCTEVAMVIARLLANWIDFIRRTNGCHMFLLILFTNIIQHISWWLPVSW